MITYYDSTKRMYDHLINDPDVNTVVIGDLSDVDVNKQTIFPLSHVYIPTAAPINGMMRFTVNVTCMDIVDINKDNPTKGNWKGHDNRQSIANTQLAVLENFWKSIDRGDLQEQGWEVQGDPSFAYFEDRFENLLVGWTATLTIDVPNLVQNCIEDVTPIEGIFDPSFDNTFN